MSRTQTINMAEEVVRLHYALALSLKGVRALAERVKQDTPDARAQEQMEKVLSRLTHSQKRPPAQPMKERPALADRRLRRFGRALAVLSESQLNLVIGLARSMVRENPKDGHPHIPKGKD